MVALNLRQVHSQVVTQLTEFSLPGVLEAELESLLGNIMVETLYSRIVSKKVQTLSV